jgi:uncharacterized protein YjbJ (UPF0337 family)
LGDAKSSLGDAKSSLGDAESSLGDAESSVGDAKSSVGDAKSSLGDAKSSLGDVQAAITPRTRPTAARSASIVQLGAMTYREPPPRSCDARRRHSAIPGEAAHATLHT